VPVVGHPQLERPGRIEGGRERKGDRVVCCYLQGVAVVRLLRGVGEQRRVQDLLHTAAVHESAVEARASVLVATGVVVAVVGVVVVGAVVLGHAWA